MFCSVFQCAKLFERSNNERGTHMKCKFRFLCFCRRGYWFCFGKHEKCICCNCTGDCADCVVSPEYMLAYKE